MIGRVYKVGNNGKLIVPLNNGMCCVIVINDGQKVKNNDSIDFEKKFDCQSMIHINSGELFSGCIEYLNISFSEAERYLNIEVS